MATSPTSEAELCNEALLYVGNGQTINDLDEDTMEAKASKVYFAKTRDALLQSFPWKFATKRAVLAQLAGEARTGWAYAYALPADCLQPRGLWMGLRMPAVHNRIPFDIESYSTNGAVSGRCLVTDQAGAELLYTARVTNVALFPPLFFEALAWQLAMKFCLILPIKPAVASQMAAAAAAAFNKAGAAELRASQQDGPPLSEYTSAR